MTEPIIIEKIIDRKYLLDCGDIIEVSKDHENSMKCYIIQNCPNIKYVNIETLIKNVTGIFNRYNAVIIDIQNQKTNIEMIWGSFEDIKNLGLYAEQAIYFKIEGNFTLPPMAAGQLESFKGCEQKTVNNVIGSPGRDTFTATVNRDHFRGGLGHDTYIYEGLDWGHDTIHDAHGYNTIIFKDTDNPNSFVLKRDYERLVIKRPDFGHSIQIPGFFKDGNPIAEFSFEHQVAGKAQKYALMVQKDGSYKLDLINS